jgi:hypothetical protein
MKSQQPAFADDEHRVLKFRPRTSVELRDRDHTASPPDDESEDPNGLARYEHRSEEPDDFRHRMLANLAALAFTVALTAAGIWLAMSIADLRNTQDCVLMGRRDCAHIATPHS